VKAAVLRQGRYKGLERAAEDLEGGHLEEPINFGQQDIWR